MNPRVTPLLRYSALGLLLAACASERITSTAPSAPAAKRNAPVAQGDRSRTPSGYRPVHRDGKELFCKREVMTGSRTSASETCVTAQQLEAQRRETDSMMRRVQEMNNGRQTTDAGGGVYNSVMTAPY